MSSAWEAAIEHVLWFETGGDIINGAPHSDPDDPGGFTKWGISKKAWPKLDIVNLTKDQASKIYFNHYWLSPKISLLPPVVGIQVFDFGVTAGPYRAIRILQRTLNLKVDGNIGQKTIAACADPEAARKYLITRLNFYRKLKKSKYESGWENRAAACALIAGAYSCLKENLA